MVLEQVQRVNPEDVEQQIGQAADSLYGMTLLKRVKVEISGLKDGFLPSNCLVNLHLGGTVQISRSGLKEPSSIGSTPSCRDWTWIR